MFFYIINLFSDLQNQYDIINQSYNISKGCELNVLHLNWLN